MEKNIYNYESIEKKWQNKWFKEKIYEAKKNKKNKFFIHFAYPGVSGYLHVGHMRGFTYSDIIARYKRMNNFDVIFPAGFHASGIPSFGFAKKVERNDPDTINTLLEYGCDKNTINKLTDPKNVVEYFGEIYVEDYWKKFGFLIDYSRIMSTISPGYQKFIKWQFHQLNDKKLLVQKPHFAPFCSNCGPVAVDKSETDISQGGSAEIQEFTAIKFKLNDGTILPAATLRPETIFGVTNMWVNPDVEYEKVKVDDEIWICSKECIEKIKYQLNKITQLNEKIPGKKLIGQTCKIPLINRDIKILSGPFADPSVATGIVMSVPAHAPYDWIALVESGEKIEPIQIIEVKGFDTNPAKEACDALDINSQKEIEKLDMATDTVYKKEFHTGILNENCMAYAGVKVSDIKDEVKNELIDTKKGVIIREFSEKVVCRCGKKVIIKKIPDQWFIKYSDNKLTENSKKYVETMNLFPEEYKKELPRILDWFDDRACIRKGSWLGTEFPFKKEWIVEPISDSTLYPIYYLISKYVNEGKIKSEEMTNDFFNYIFLNIGTSKNKIWDEIKSDFEYWYPVDINLGGKEHKTVHFPVFLMNHVAIMPNNKRPRGIFVHWWVTQKGKEKISKSKGGAEHIAKAAQTYGVDAMRLYYAHVGSPFVDIEWDSEVVMKYKNKIANVWKLIMQLLKIDKENNKNLDKWLQSILNRRILKIADAFENFDLRVASNEIFFECQKDIQWYLSRGGGNKQLVYSYVSSWIKLITPFTPHLAEELWNLINIGFVSNEAYPIFNKNEISQEAEVGEYLLLSVVEDINEILKVTKIKSNKICIYISPNWKIKAYRKAISLCEDNKLNVGVLIKEIISDPKMKIRAKEVSQFVSKLPGEIKKLNINDKNRYLVKFESLDYLINAKQYLSNLFECDIEIFSADEENVYDPANKIRFAVPLRPAIYIE